MDCAGILLLLFLFQGETRKRRSAEAASVRRFPDDDDVVADLSRFPRHVTMDHFILPDDAVTYHIDEAITVIGCIKLHVTAEVGDAECISISRDAAHDFLCNCPGLFG